MMWMLIIRPTATRQAIMEAISLDRHLISQLLPRFVATSTQDSPYYSIVPGKKLRDAVRRPDL